MNMSISRVFIPNSLCVFSQIKARKYIKKNFHSVARVMPRVGLVGAGGVKNFSLGICDGTPSTARSSISLGFQAFFLSFLKQYAVLFYRKLMTCIQNEKKGLIYEHGKTCYITY